jgi:hypothetical protein
MQKAHANISFIYNNSEGCMFRCKYYASVRYLQWNVKLPHFTYYDGV